MTEQTKIENEQIENQMLVVTEEEFVSSKEAKEKVRLLFSDCSFLYHATYASNLPNIFNLGGLAAKAYLGQEGIKARGDSGRHGISFNFNQVVVAPGEEGRLCGFLTSPTAALKPWLKLSPTYYSAESELQLLNEDLDVSEYAVLQASEIFWLDCTGLSYKELDDGFVGEPTNIETIIEDFRSFDIDHFESLINKIEEVNGEFIYTISPEYGDVETDYISLLAYIHLQSQDLLKDRKLSEIEDQEIRGAFENSKVQPASQYLHFSQSLNKYNANVAIDLQNMVFIAPESMKDEVMTQLEGTQKKPSLVFFYSDNRDISEPSSWFSGSRDARKIHDLIQFILHESGVTKDPQVTLNQLLVPELDYISDEKKIMHLNGNVFRKKEVKSIKLVGESLEVI